MTQNTDIIANDPFIRQLLLDRDAVESLIDNLESFSDVFQKLPGEKVTTADIANILDGLANGAKWIRSKA